MTRTCGDGWVRETRKQLPWASRVSTVCFPYQRPSLISPSPQRQPAQSSPCLPPLSPTFSHPTQIQVFKDTKINCPANGSREAREGGMSVGPKTFGGLSVYFTHPLPGLHLCYGVVFFLQGQESRGPEEQSLHGLGVPPGLRNQGSAPISNFLAGSP